MTSKHISSFGLLNTVRNFFRKVPDLISAQGNGTIPLVDCLLSGLAVFKMKAPSLLQFDKLAHGDPAVKHNLKSLFGIFRVPSDTQMRSRLDVVDPEEIRPVFKQLFSVVQRNKLLENFVFYDGNYLLALDGVSHFSSKKVHCDHCLTKNHRDGSVTYHHQCLAAAIVNPNMRQVLPLAPEPIVNADGDTKNDCERNAAKRLTIQIRSDHPKLNMIVLGDGLYANAPFINHCLDLKMHFILIAKESDHECIVDYMKYADEEEAKEFEESGPKEISKRRYRYVNDVPLNYSNEDCRVNVLQFWETDKNGKERYWMWVTDIELTHETAKIVMEGGRARWKIENETFNTLKNQGYNFEHNYGHGQENLCTNFVYLMMCAFLVDQVLELGCKYFKMAYEMLGSRKALWSKMRGMFSLFHIENWDALFQAIITKYKVELKFNDSG